ncbi:MAG: 1,4-alpha-glucan branching protein GlgB [Dehalococcoidia bacterium]
MQAWDGDRVTVAQAELEQLRRGTMHDPHSYLGIHPQGKGLVVRVFEPGADAVTVVEVGGEQRRVPLTAIGGGLFEARLTAKSAVFPYNLELTTGSRSWSRGDPYRFLPTLGEQDLFYLGEGSHRRAWERLGAHPRLVDGETGVGFAVWAPAARGVSVMGDFNGWQRTSYPMRALGNSGIWEVFIPGLAVGEHYKYVVRGADGVERDKADPFGLYAEVRPRTASIVFGLGDYQWGDGDWMVRRREHDYYHQPMSVYELHLGSWRCNADGSWLGYREAGVQLASYCREMGYTHVELLPLTEHPFDGSWGYQVAGFYAPTSRFGTPDDLRAFVDTLHRAGIGVFVDWVPAHFATDAHSLAQFDGTYLYEHQDERKRFQPDWGTLTFNYGRHEVRNFLLANALYWIKEFHIDGLRVDAVSSMLYLDYSRDPGEWAPNKYGGRENLEAIEFLRMFNQLVYEEGEGAITMAEESTAWPGVSRPVYANGLGFGFKWNMGWMHDTLEYFRKEPVHRRYHQGVLTFSMMYAWSENFLLSLSHDEVVHGKASLLHKMPGDEWQQFANLRLLYAYQYAMPGKKLLFMGGEFGQRSEWDHDVQLGWEALAYPLHEGLRAFVRDLNSLYRARPGLHRYDHEPRGFEWLDFSDSDNSVLVFVRHGDQPAEDIICVFNLTPVPRFGYRVPVPRAGSYREVLNSDAELYGGGNVGNAGLAIGEVHAHNGHPFSMALTLPPLGALFLQPTGEAG